ncbi:hypothetical protein C8R44DRAFT_436792 [Mycena epipterygia]|nr:hypothetical protein C8R44DRAFT_436792 [Mycena epipterygia]
MCSGALEALSAALFIVIFSAEVCAQHCPNACNLQLFTATDFHGRALAVNISFTHTFMPKSPVQSAPTWLANLRWLYVLFRQRFRKLRLRLSSVILRNQIALRVRRALFSPYNHVGSAKDPESLHYPRDRVTHSDMITILPSSESAHGGFDVVFALADTGAADQTLAINGAANADSQPDREMPVSMEAISASAVPASHSPDGSSTLSTTSTPRSSDDTRGPSATSKISAIFPEHFARYRLRETISRERVERTIEPQTFSFASEDTLPHGWIPILHPEGARYFCDPKRRIFTELNICEEQNFANLTQVVQHVVMAIHASGNEMAPHYSALLERAPYSPNSDLRIDLVIEMDPSKSEPICGYYYFVNHSERCLFFLHPVVPSDYLAALNTIDGPIEKERLRHGMECQYWKHCTIFPNAALPLTKQLIDELQDCIVYGIGDVSTSFTSTVTRSIEDLRHWLDIVRNFRHDDLGSASTLARMMEQFAHDRFLNFHGLPCARLNQNQSVYDSASKRKRRSYLFRIASPFLFFAPEVYRQSLENAYVDETALARVWEPFIHKLNTEWHDFTLFATVVLNANVAFLSIKSVDTLTDNGHHSVEQIASYLSIVASIGSIVLGLLLVRQNRTKFHESAVDIATSVGRRSSKRFGLELLAVIFSLPYALLVWSMIMFFVAFMATCMRVQDTVAWSTIGSAAAIMTALVLWCIWDAWDMQETADHASLLSTWGHAIGSAWRTILHPSSTENPPPESLQDHPPEAKRPSKPKRTLSLFARRVTEKDTK